MSRKDGRTMPRWLILLIAVLVILLIIILLVEHFHIAAH
jgi:hypothetical protein